MKYIKSLSTTAELEQYIAQAENNYYILEDQSAEDLESIVYLRPISHEDAGYLTFTAQEPNSTIKYQPSTVTTASYTTNGITWNSFDNETVTLANAGDKIYVKGTISGDQDVFVNTKFVMTGKFKVSGSIMSLYNENPDDTEIDYTYAFFKTFYNCSALADASELVLPATTLSERCYGSMFQICTSLTSAPELPAENLADGCYAQMFNGCTSLETAPELPAEIMEAECYSSMFDGCTSLSVAPELPATTLADGCYSYMFRGTYLTSAPELPATVLAPNCYNSMFSGCADLTTLSALPATTLAEKCYFNMFNNCLALSSDIVLPADTLASQCYDWMLYGTNVSSVTINVVEWNRNNASNWLHGAETGTVYCPAGCTIPLNSNSGVPTGWNVVYGQGYDYLTFTAEEAGSTVKYNILEYTIAQFSLDGGTTWTNAVGVTVTLTNVGDKVNYRGVIFGDLSTSSTTPRFTMTGKIAASGSIMSMYNNNPNDTTITYNAAFRNMFLNCSSLTTAPELTPTEMASNCYSNMFMGCSSLTSVTHNIIDWKSVNAKTWLKGVAASGTVTCPSDSTIPADNPSGIPTGWTRVDID